MLTVFETNVLTLAHRRGEQTISGKRNSFYRSCGALVQDFTGSWLLSSVKSLLTWVLLQMRRMCIFVS